MDPLEVRRERAHERVRGRGLGREALRLDHDRRLTRRRQRLLEAQPRGVGEVGVVCDDQLTRGQADVDLDRRRRRGEQTPQRQLVVAAVGLDLEAHATNVASEARFPWPPGR